MSGVDSAEELWNLATALGVIAEWLEKSCEARHADDMGEVVRWAERVITDLASEQEDLEGSGMTDKAIGQIAFEASQDWHGSHRNWNDTPLAEQAHWEHVANAVYDAAARVMSRKAEDES